MPTRQRCGASFVCAVQDEPLVKAEESKVRREILETIVKFVTATGARAPEVKFAFYKAQPIVHRRWLL
jgi:hypothetical protein